MLSFVSGCIRYRIVALEAFLSSVRRVMESHYSTDTASKRKFVNHLATEWETIARNPLGVIGASPEPWPPGKTNSRNGFDLYKLRFYMPGLRGSARRGRFMYLVHDASCSVFAIWLYTHEEFDRRPPAGDLRDELRRSTEVVLQQLRGHPLELAVPGKDNIVLLLATEDQASLLRARGLTRERGRKKRKPR